MDRRFLPDGIEVISTSRIVMWRKNGIMHRENGPAYERTDGTRRYYRNGLLHRDDGPAVIHPDGTCLWFRHGVLCREDGPAILLGDGAREWIWSCNSHREDAKRETPLPAPDPLQIERMMEIIATFGFQEA